MDSSGDVMPYRQNIDSDPRALRLDSHGTACTGTTHWKAMTDSTFVDDRQVRKSESLSHNYQLKKKHEEHSSQHQHLVTHNQSCDDI
jgi:hypothetical protein